MIVPPVLCYSFLWTLTVLCTDLFPVALFWEMNECRFTWSHRFCNLDGPSFGPQGQDVLRCSCIEHIPYLRDMFFSPKMFTWKVKVQDRILNLSKESIHPRGRLATLEGYICSIFQCTRYLFVFRWIGMGWFWQLHESVTPRSASTIFIFGRSNDCSNLWSWQWQGWFPDDSVPCFR